MKTIKKLLFTTASILFFGSGIQAQKIQYFYFAPEATMLEAFGENAKVFNRKNGEGKLYTELPGYRYVLVKSSNVEAFRRIAAPNMLKTYERLNSTSSLRQEIDNLRQLSGGLVDVNIMLVDDRTGLSNTQFFCPSVDNTDNKLMVWPCARNRKKKSGNNYLGQVFIGERVASQTASKPGGFINWEGTLIHEFSHTQFLPDPEYGPNKWKSVGISYGGDSGHWINELMADEQMALDEGIGYFFGLAHNPTAARDLVNFLNKNSPKYALGSRSFLSGIPEMWDSPHEVIFSGSVSNIPESIKLVHRPSEGSYELRIYKWLDVPGKYLMYNEQMPKAYFYLINTYAFADKRKAYRRIFSAATEMAKPNVHNRYPSFAANHIAKSMEQYASSVHGNDDAAKNQLVSSMFAYGVYDLLTHFGLSEEDFKRTLRVNQSGSTLPIAYTKYWSHRSKLQKLVCPYLGGNDCQSGSANIDILMATEVMRDYFLNSSLILKEDF